MKDYRKLDLEEFEQKEYSIITYALRHMSFDNISIDMDYYENLCSKVDRNYDKLCYNSQIEKEE